MSYTLRLWDVTLSSVAWPLKERTTHFTVTHLLLSDVTFSQHKSRLHYLWPHSPKCFSNENDPSHVAVNVIVIKKKKTLSGTLIPVVSRHLEESLFLLQWSSFQDNPEQWPGGPSAPENPGTHEGRYIFTCQETFICFTTVKQSILSLIAKSVFFSWQDFCKEYVHAIMNNRNFCLHCFLQSWVNFVDVIADYVQGKRTANWMNQLKGFSDTFGRFQRLWSQNFYNPVVWWCNLCFLSSLAALGLCSQMPH